MAEAMLALPAAAGSARAAGQARRTLNLGVIAIMAAGTTLIGGLIGAHLALKSASPHWIPKGVSFDNYTAVTLAVTVLMASVTVEWAAYGIRQGYRGQSLFAFALTFGLGIAYLNGLYYLIEQFKFGPGKTAYGTSVTALTVTAFVIGLIGLFSVVVTGLRALGHQVTEANPYLVRAAAWLWHFAAGAWIAVFYTVYIAH